MKKLFLKQKNTDEKEFILIVNSFYILYRKAIMV